MGRLQAAQAAVDELMEVASALAFSAPLDADAKKQVELVLTKARTARAALEAMGEGTEPHPPLIQPYTGVQPDPDVKPSVKSEGSGMAFETMRSPKERGGPKDADQAPTVFKAALGEGSGQIHPVANFQHCELCGRRLDTERPDPCSMPECPHPRPQDVRT